MERIKITDLRELRRRISWGSIIGGVMTVLAVSLLLSILGSSVGLIMFDPVSSDPMSGIGTTMGIWTVISLLISLAAGGFVAGKLAGADGIIHGFLVWATTLIVAVILMVSLAAGAVKMTANILGSVTSAAGSVLSGVGSVVESGVSGISDNVGDLFSDIDLNSEEGKNEVRQDVREALRKSGVKEFQPEYLQNQMGAIKSDFDKSVKKLATHPNDAETILNDFLDKLGTRADNYAKNIDRDDLTKAIANNSNLSKAEVDKAADEYMILIDNMREQGNEKINEFKQSIEQAKQDWERMKQNARVEAEKATNAAGRSGIVSFFALLIGAVLCSFTGAFGVRKTQEGYEA